jgi:hypothetical protein
MRVVSAFLTALLVSTVSCGPSQSERDQAERDFQNSLSQVQRHTENLKWENEQLSAARLWCRVPEGWGRMTVGELVRLDSCQMQPQFATFVKCHDEPPTKEANKKLCANLQTQLDKAKVRWEKQEEQKKREW